MSIIAYDAGKEDGKKEKQEEILKLLEKLASVTGYVEIEFSKLSALIKGEDK